VGGCTVSPMTTTLKFVDELPPRSSPKGHTAWGPVVERLRAGSPQWALIEAAQTIERGKAIRTGLTRHGAEVVQRQNEDGVDVYARWPES
jgi:hypothetical protein